MLFQKDGNRLYKKRMLLSKCLRSIFYQNISRSNLFRAVHHYEEVLVFAGFPLSPCLSFGVG